MLNHKTNLKSRIKVLEGIARGEAAIRDGRILSQRQSKSKMKRWLKESAQ